MPPLKSFEAKLQKNRRLSERLADDVTRLAGSFTFFLANLSFFIFWIAANTGLIPGLPIIDPFPFILLTMIVSLEAIFLSIFVLISQNRAASISSVREEIHFQIDQIAEREITKALQLISDIHKHLLPDSGKDPQLEHMLHALNTSSIQQNIERELEPQPMVISELVEKVEGKIFRPTNSNSK